MKLSKISDEAVIIAQKLWNTPYFLYYETLYIGFAFDPSVITVMIMETFTAC